MTDTTYAQPIARELAIRTGQVTATVALLDEGNTIPFIARYRKEATGGLDEEQLRSLQTSLERRRALEERRASVLASIEEQGKLTSELRAAITAVETLTALEDLYLPYRPKRRTRASIARDRGLQPLADLVLQQARSTQDALSLAAQFISDQVPTPADALDGACDIAAETISDHPDVRREVREKASKWGQLVVGKIAAAQDEKRVYETYYTFTGRVDRLRPHQTLAINRGEAEKVLRVKLEVDPHDWQAVIYRRFRPDPNSPFYDALVKTTADAAERLLLPAIERDVRRALKEAADAHAIGVFAANLRALLSQPPLAGHTVLGIDPGFRTGCKVAVVDPTGKLLEIATIYPHEPQKQRSAALQQIQSMIEQHGVTLIAIGNGTASRETEQLAVELIARVNTGLQYLIASEAGASVYSASPLARAELPGLDVSLRGAVSIARRVQDPLAELVKIDPKSIGVGLYQHDLDQAALSRALVSVVESVVNQVGVDLNTASPALLAHVAGVGPKLAERIVAQRDQQGAFKSRAALKSVSGLGPKVFEQAAGFLRVRGGANPLDATAIHPESYPVAENVLKMAGIGINTKSAERQRALDQLLLAQPIARLAETLGAGIPTLTDILEQLNRPGRDPREDLPPPILRSDVIQMEDLKLGMALKGTVRNVVDFGAFVDIGVKQDGLLHRSQIPSGISLRAGDVIDINIGAIDSERGRIALLWPQ